MWCKRSQLDMLLLDAIAQGGAWQAARADPKAISAYAGYTSRPSNQRKEEHLALNVSKKVADAKAQLEKDKDSMHFSPPVDLPSLPRSGLLFFEHRVIGMFELCRHGGLNTNPVDRFA